MPLADRSIQPTWLGRRKLTDEEKDEEVCHIAVSHNAVVGVLVQLASLVRHADDLFCDLAEECQSIFEKTESITTKIHNIERIVLNMDSTQVKIPLGTLEEFSHVKEHHVARHGFDCNLFTPANRPYCIKAQHSMCDVTPVHALRGVDLYRKDGLSTSILFKLWPIALKDTEIKSENMNIPSERVPFQPHLNNKKRYKELKLRSRADRPKTIDSLEGFFFQDEAAANDLHNGLSKSQPSMLVAVDTSGAGFERMASFRRSGPVGVAGGGDVTYHHSLDRKRRRRTVHGIGENLIQEIEQFEKGRRILRQGPRKYSLDNLDNTDIDAKDEMMQQFLSEIDNQRAEREELEYAAERDRKLLKKFIPCRRAKSLPRCVKLLSDTFTKRESSRTPLYVKRRSQRVAAADEMRLTREDTCTNTTVHNFGGSSASLVSSGTGRLSRSSTRSSILGNKIRSLMAGAAKKRPKSLDFDSVGVIDEEDKKKKKDKTQGAAERSVSMSRIGAAAPTPEGVARAASSESTIGPGSYYYFDSNTIPRAQQCKYNFPWDSLPKDWTTAVKLREITKRRKEERQSSSGNWSASGYSSSNRQSLDSDARPGPPGMPSFLASQHSIGRDSGRDSPIEERDGLDTGYMGDAASMESISDTKSTSNTDSDDWIKSLAERAASRSDVTSTSADALANLSRLTKENIRNLDILVPGRSQRHRLPRMDLDEDGESSVYSLDQDGFYTSFHNDSGLRRSTNNLLEEDEDLMMPRIRECKSLQSMSSSFSTSDSSALFRSSNSTGKLASISLMPRSSSHDSESQDTTLDATQPESEALEDCGVEYGETGTIKAAKKNRNKSKKTPPPPPPRTSSCLKSETGSGAEKDDYPEMLNVGDSSPTISESSDQETIYARLKMKTRISAQAIPSLCSNVLSDDDDALSRDMTLTSSQERLNAEAIEMEEILHGGKLPGTLPRVKKTLSIKKEWDEFEYPANSWPRLKKSPGSQQQPGILKTPEKDKGRLPSQQKTLNFDPVVNLYDSLTPGGKQMPLSRVSSSDESPSSPPTNFCVSTFGSPAVTTGRSGFKSGIQNVYDVNDFHQHKNTEIPSKWENRLSSSTPIADTNRSLMPQLDNTITSADNCHPVYPHSSSSSSSSFLDNLSQDSFHGLEPKPLGSLDRDADMQGSTSTIALSDIDSASLTRVSETNSTTSGSVLSLNWDSDNTPNLTPMPTPARQHKVYVNNTNGQGTTPSLNDLSPPLTNGYGDRSSLKENKNNNNHQNDFRRSELKDLNDSQNTSSLPPPPPPLQTSSLPQSSPSAMSPPLPPPPPPPSSSLPPSVQDQHNITNSPYVPSDSDRVNSNDNSNRNHNNNIIVNSKYKSYSESSSSDNNHLHSHHQNNSSHPSHPEPHKPNIPKSSSWSENTNNEASRPKKNGVQSNSFQYNPSWSGGSTSKYQVRISHQSRNPTQQPSNYVERRRSNPVAVEEYNASQWNNDATRHGMAGDDPSHRRQSSGANLMSPTDSGFGSTPSVSNPPTPNHTTTNPNPYNYHRPSNRSSLPPSSSVYNRQDPSNSHPKVPQIKQPLLHNEPSKMSNPPSPYHRPPTSHNTDPLCKPMAASHSNESLSSHSSSSSSSKHFTPQNPHADYTRPILLRGSSNESLKSNSSAGRSDSYRCAQMSEYDDKTSLLSKKELLPSHAKPFERQNVHNNVSKKELLPPQTKQEERQNIYKNKYGARSFSTSSANPPTASSNTKGGRTLTKSVSTPAPSSTLNTPVPFSSLMSPASVCDPEVFNRADSYRCAMQNSENSEQNNNVHPSRNSSYRFATAEDDVVFNSRMDFYNNMWTGSSGGKRDSRRMGITDVDQLKSFDSNHDPDRRRSSVKEGGQPAVQLRQPPRSNAKDNKMKQKSQSSSYIRFDPIFESREDVRASKESLRPPSITSIRTLTKTDSSDTLTAETAYLMNYKRTSKSPTRKRSGSQSRRSGDEKTTSTGFLGTLKTTIKSIGGSKGDNN